MASCQYPIDRLADWAVYRRKLESLVAEAANEGAQLLLFPEYGAMELTSLLPEPVRADLQAQLAALQPLLPQFLSLHHELARRHGVWLVAASYPVLDDGHYRNRAYLIGPDGEEGFQEKRIMTRFEREEWSIAAGRGLRIFTTPFGKLAINICYDAEFPLLAHAQVAAGADILLVPSCTDGWAGYHRIRVACQARALENQCYVVQSPTVGNAPWSPAVDINIGKAGVFAPPEQEIGETGVLAEGEANHPGWLFAELDLARLAAVRETGQVLNLRDWPEQKAVAATDVEVITLQ
ncbi:carbon-nitrogen hydrolase family protein [Endothiovibrio diazotrophicus]